MKENIETVQDYWKFTRDLKSQLGTIELLEKQFFALDDLCEYAVRNKVTCLDDDGQRVSIIDDCLGKQQMEVFRKMKKAVCDLGKMLECGDSCFVCK